MPAALQYEQRRLALERWSPLRLPGLLWWIDLDWPGGRYQDAAMTLPATQDLDPIGAVRDRSGWGRHATASGASRPTLRTGAVAAGAIGRWDGVDDFLAASLPGDSRLHLALVTAVTNLTSHRVIMGGTSSTTFLRLLAPGTGADVRDDAGSYASWSLAPVDAALHLLEFRISDGEIQRYVDGSALEAPGSWNPGTITLAQLGARGGTESLAGDVGEVILLRGRPPEAELQRMRSYLRRRWGTP